MKDYTKDQKEQYLKKSYCCPKCGSSDISGGEHEFNSGYASQECSCICGERWTDIYKLVDVEKN